MQKCYRANIVYPFRMKFPLSSHCCFQFDELTAQAENIKNAFVPTSDTFSLALYAVLYL